MAGGDIIWHPCDGADGCGVTSSYPAALVGTRVKCPNPACPRLLTLPGPDLPLADPIADEPLRRRPAPPAGYASLPPSRGRRGIKWNGRVNHLFSNMEEWNTVSLTLKGYAGERDRASDLLVTELDGMGNDVKLSRPEYREHAVGGRCVRVESTIDGILDVVADISIVTQYDSLTLTVRKYWLNEGNAGARFVMGMLLFPALCMCGTPLAVIINGSGELAEHAGVDPRITAVVLVCLVVVLFGTGVVLFTRLTYSLIRYLLIKGRFDAAHQRSVAFEHRIDQAVRAVLGELGVPDVVLQRS